MSHPPEMGLTNRALRLLTDADLKRVLRCMQRDHEIIEWETIGLTFVLCTRGIDFTYNRRTEHGPVIYRAGALGGDVRDVHGGWLYLTEMHARAEWREIGEVAKAYARL